MKHVSELVHLHISFLIPNLKLEIPNFTYPFLNFRFALRCIITKKSIIFLIFKTGLQFKYFDGCPGLKNLEFSVRHLYQYHTLHSLSFNSIFFIYFYFIHFGYRKKQNENANISVWRHLIFV